MSMDCKAESEQRLDGYALWVQNGSNQEQLLDYKGTSSISVIIPARNEAATIGAIIGSIRSECMLKTNLVDELIVINDVSSDNTSGIAKESGADVIDMSNNQGVPFGKGAALREGIRASSGDILLFLDADVTNFSSHFVTEMLAPLLIDKKLMLCKPKYQRFDGGTSFGGGRVTELVAKPVLEILLPQLACIDQPLAGETSIRRELLEKICVADNYQVEIAILIDTYRLYGEDVIAQVDLGQRYHKSRTLTDLVPTAKDVLQAMLERLM